jgi:3-phytase
VPLLSFAFLPAAAAPAQPQPVVPVVETESVPHSGDAADDPAIWVHPSDPALSRVIGADKEGALLVYDLAGAELQVLSVGNPNNVDVRYGVSLAGAPTDIAAASDRSDDTIDVYAIDPTTGLLSPISSGAGIAAGIEVLGLCLYVSPTTGNGYAFVTSESGEVEQWQLLDDGSGDVTGTLVRSFDVGSDTEGCVADDELAALYIGEEQVGIWRYGAEPGDGAARSAVDSVASGNLTADVEGLTLYQASDGGGYLLASSQGDDSFAVYLRGPGNTFVGSFELVAGGGIDAVTGTDGIDVVNAPLGGAFPQGAFVAQDDEDDAGNQNFKLARWEDVANAFAPPLAIDTRRDPRGEPPPPAPQCDDGFDNDGDGELDFPNDLGCQDLGDDSEDSEGSGEPPGDDAGDEDGEDDGEGDGDENGDEDGDDGDEDGEDDGDEDGDGDEADRDAGKAERLAAKLERLDRRIERLGEREARVSEALERADGDRRNGLTRQLEGIAERLTKLEARRAAVQAELEALGG